MKFAVGLTTTLALLAGAASGNVFEDDAHPSANGKGRGPPDANTNQANGRRRGPLGGVTPGASAADCAKPLDIKLYADSPSSIRFRPDPRACRSGAAFAGASDDGHSHLTLVPGRGNSGSFRASVVDDVTGAVYSIQPNADGEMEVVERLQEDYGPELDPEDIMPPSERRLLESRIAAKNSQEPAASLRGKVANQLKELGDNFLSENDKNHRSLQTPTVMDVLVLWTSYAECRNSGKARTCTDLSTTTENNIRGLIDLAITETNTAYTLSGVNAELNLIHAAPTTYVESGGFSPSLSDLASGVVQGADLRSVYGADMVALIIDDPQYCGIAYLGPSYNSMFSVTAWNCATGYYSFGHEIGHNQGCNHDRGTSNACSNTEYRYGYRDPQANFRSILAYNCNSGQCDGNAGGGCTRVGRFSNNYGYQWNGQAIGNAQNDNARRINDVKDTIAAYETACPTCTPNPTPSPTTPPPTPSPTPCPPTGCTTPLELFTTLAENNGSQGNTFKIAAKKDIEIAGFDVHNSGTGSINVQVWHRAGDYTGSEGSSTGWTQILSTSVTAAGGGVATVLPEFGSRVSVTAGATHSFHIHTGTNHRYTNGGTEGNMYTENTDLAFYEGKGCGGVFSCTFSPRVFNGAIKYFNAPAGTPGPTNPPSPFPTKFPTNQPTPLPTNQPTTQPTNPPTTAPTPQPTGAPSESPSKGPTGSPITDSPTTSPSKAPSKSPSTSPTPSPSKAPVPAPTDNPTTSPSRAPSKSPSASPSRSPSKAPVPEPTGNPTSSPTKQPTNEPTPQPTDSPTLPPLTAKPTTRPSKNPTGSPSTPPSLSPSKEPTPLPTKAPVTPNPTNFPTAPPTNSPTKAPTDGPTGSPSKKPTPAPTNVPTPTPTDNPTPAPTPNPTPNPTTAQPTFDCSSITRPNGIKKSTHCTDVNPTCIYYSDGRNGKCCLNPGEPQTRGACA